MSHFLLHSQSRSLMLDHPVLDHIYVGSFYEIDHSKLPPNSPVQLNSIRVVMVHDKTRMRVSLRFPSISSLIGYFHDTNCNFESEVKTLPQLDEKCIIRPEIASEALYRRISSEEINLKKRLWHFWAVPSISAQRLSTSSPSISRARSYVVSKKGCLSELENTGVVKWGHRRQVMYFARNKGKSVISCNFTVGKEEIEGDEEEEEDDEKEENAVEEEIDDLENRKQGKRKQLQRSCKVIQKKKKIPKRENKNQIAVYKHKKKKVLKNSIDRWSAQRYNLAEENMLKIMKEQDAIFGKPILRPQLRAEARKLIGDTGLLDHLLKHMAGKLAPGGVERFRRRHNAEGAMEYWLEKAELAEIRREAGVQDPYWTPPPGWNPGDNPTQDPICAKEFKSLKEDISDLKRSLEMLLSKKNEEEHAIVATPISSITGCSIEHDNFLAPLKEMYIDLINKKSKIEEQLTEISQSLCWMEEENEKMKTKPEQSNRSTESSDAELIALPETASTATEQKEKALAREEKVAKIERLRSGFRICKPQGTFLWPNMSISSPQASVQFEDMFSVPTPPSVSSTTATHPRLLSSPISPVRPLALIRPISSPLSCQSNTSRDSMINLNEVPSNQNDNVSPSQSQNSSFPVTYQRRNQAAIACLGTNKKQMNQWEGR